MSLNAFYSLDAREIRIVLKFQPSKNLKEDEKKSLSGVMRFTFNTRHDIESGKKQFLNESER